MKEITDLNVKALSDALQNTIIEQVGGNLRVELVSFNQVRNDRTDITFGTELELKFSVIDHSLKERWPTDES